MEDVLIRTDTLPLWLYNKYFSKDALISIEELISTIEDLDAEVERLTEEFEDFKEDVKSNYKFIPQEEQIGYNSNW